MLSPQGDGGEDDELFPPDSPLDELLDPVPVASCYSVAVAPPPPPPPGDTGTNVVCSNGGPAEDMVLFEDEDEMEEDNAGGGAAAPHVGHPPASASEDRAGTVTAFNSEKRGTAVPVVVQQQEHLRASGLLHWCGSSAKRLPATGSSSKRARLEKSSAPDGPYLNGNADSELPLGTQCFANQQQVMGVDDAGANSLCSRSPNVPQTSEVAIPLHFSVLSGSQRREGNAGALPGEDPVVCAVSSMESAPLKAPPPSLEPPKFKEMSDSLSGWCLPAALVQEYAAKRITRLFPWQKACLFEYQQQYCKTGGQSLNLIYSAPTSGGKTLVAEMLLFKRLLATKRKALFIVPFVALANEKADHLTPLATSIGKTVRCHAGGKGQRILSDDILVCTTEKANVLLNIFMEANRMHEIGMVVVDELHQLADPSRGYVLELVLTKLLNAPCPSATTAGVSATELGGQLALGSAANASTGQELFAYDEGGVAIVGMSATLGNGPAVAKWLGDALLFMTDYRPVPLEEFYVIGRTVRTAEDEVVRELPLLDTKAGWTEDTGVVELCVDGLREGFQTLIFCPSRKSCETTAHLLAQKFRHRLALQQIQVSPKYHEGEAQRRQLSQRLKTAGQQSGDPQLLESALVGVAYHHAALMGDEKTLIESAFREGTLLVLCATTTLATGVNLPARRVIFRSPRIGIEALDSTRYRQAAGRAGRLGLDSKGEAYILGRLTDRFLMRSLLKACLPPVLSNFGCDKRGMMRVLLEGIANKSIRNVLDIQRYIMKTFLSVNVGYAALHSATKQALEFLERHEFIEWCTEEQIFFCTPLGVATVASCLAPDEALLLHAELSAARSNFVMTGDLHLIYHSTPPFHALEPDWHGLYAGFNRLSQEGKEVAEKIGISEMFLMQAEAVPPRRDAQSPEIIKHRRFFGALILHDVVREIPLSTVAAQYGLPKGELQRLMESAAQFASLVSTFCDKLNWWFFPPLFDKMAGRLHRGVEQDLLPLMAISGLVPWRARQLYKAGYKTLLSVATAPTEELEEVVKVRHQFRQHQQGPGGSGGKAQGGPIDPAVNTSGLGVGGGTGQQMDTKALARLLQRGACEALQQEAEELSLSITELNTAVPSTLSLLPTAKETTQHGTTAAHLFREHKQRRENAVLPRSAGLPAGTGNSSSSDTFHWETIHLVIYYSPAEEGDTGTDPHLWIPKLDVDEVTWARWREVRQAVLQADTVGLSFVPVSSLCLAVVFATDSDAFCVTSSETRIPSKAVNAQQQHNQLMNGEEHLRDDVGSWHPILFAVELLKQPNVTKAVYHAQRQLRNLVQRNMLLLEELFLSFPSPVVDPPASSPQATNAFAGAGAAGVTGVLDPLVAEWMLNPEDRPGGRNTLVETLARNSGVLLKAGSTCSTAMEANGLDAVHTVRVARVLQRKLESYNLLKPFVEIEMPMALVLAGMEVEGMGFDPGQYESINRKMKEKVECLVKEAYQAAGKSNWALSSPKDCAKILYDVLHLPCLENTTDTKYFPRKRRRKSLLAENRSTKGTVLVQLEKMFPEQPLPRILREFRTLTGWPEKFMLPLMNDAKPWRWHQQQQSSLLGTSGDVSSSPPLRLYGRFLQTASATGRLAMVEPSLQTIPHPIEFELNGETVPVRLREAFVPKPGFILLGADYAQIELRLLAHFSQDPSLWEALSLSNQDVFKVLAARLFYSNETPNKKGRGELPVLGPRMRDPTTVTTQERKHCKALCYGLLYGKGPGSLAEELDLTEDEARAMMSQFQALYPVATKFIGQLCKDAASKGFIETIGGRKRWLQYINSSNGRAKAASERMAINSLCQGSAADVIKWAMVQIERDIHVHSTAAAHPEQQQAMVSGPPCGRSIVQSCPLLLLPLKVEARKGFHPPQPQANTTAMVLQIHDELLFEVPNVPSEIQRVATIVRQRMEQSFSWVMRSTPLPVFLPVKVRTGPTWNDLQPFDFDAQ